MGDWHTDIVIQNVDEKEVDSIQHKVLSFLADKKIISLEKKDNVLGADYGYTPGENWSYATNEDSEYHFLTLITNGLEIRNKRTIFYAGGQDFQRIDCPICGHNNLDCDWGELFNEWLLKSNLDLLECEKCKNKSSISEYSFEPIWGFGNLGFVFWNWPQLKEEFIREIEKLIDKRVIVVEGKL